MITPHALPMNSAFLILGNQLFESRHLPVGLQVPLYLAEDYGLCSYTRHHRQKLVLFLSAMRSYADELRAAGYTVDYHAFDLAAPPATRTAYAERLIRWLQARGITCLHHFEIEDRPFEATLVAALQAAGIERREHRSPMFLTSRTEFAAYLERHPPFMARFYEWQRRRLQLLLDTDGKPLGGQWSFDADNRKKLPRNAELPAEPFLPPTDHTRALIPWVNAHFAQHPGELSERRWWLPTTRVQARAWLDTFLRERLHHFGDYEDAISQRGNVLYHSVLSVPINLGLLTPQEILDALLPAARAQRVAINNLEGFIRQIIGWREFVRGIDRHFGERQSASNVFGHQRRLGDAWYRAETGIPPLDDTLRRLQRLGWCHHIERLMVLGNLMLLCEIAPREAYRFFMDWFVDSSDWVMGPNVFGMALFSDGGIFATKPYISGSNYLLKMSDYTPGPWCDIVDGLYWRFVDRHQAFLRGYPRLGLMLGTLRQMDPARRERIFSAAEAFLERTTVVD